jgi:outer membrane lipoprotein-sorting protein
MNYVMEKFQGDSKEIEVWGTNKRWLKSAMQRKNAEAGGRVTYTVRDAGIGEQLPADKFLGNVILRHIPVTGKMEN